MRILQLSEFKFILKKISIQMFECCFQILLEFEIRVNKKLI